MEKEKTNHCYNCRWYRPVYVKKFSNFERKDAGFCVKDEAVKDKHGCCDKWEFNTPTNRYISRYLRAKAAYIKLIEALDGLKVLEQIIREEYEENKTDPLPKTK